MGDVLPHQWCPVSTPWALSTVDSVLQVSNLSYSLTIQYVFSAFISSYVFQSQAAWAIYYFVFYIIYLGEL